MADVEALFQLIVVGSSAGGIEALSKLVASLPTPFNIPIVIAQHLDPNRPSHLAAILGRHTSLRVIIVEQQELLEPGTIYVVPSNNHITITDHDVTILPDGNSRPKPSVDLLLITASEVYGEKLIAVVLTGTGSDGTVGAQIVHQNGGTVIIQNPATAAYPGMPQSLDPKTVDFVANLEEIGPLLFDLIGGYPVSSQAEPERELELEPFLNQVLEYTGIDFRIYKSPTILRRLQRRLVAVGVEDIASYGHYLQIHPEEYEQLVNSFLIKVTDFMRDPELFNFLQTQILPDLVAYSRAHQNELRCWSAGCATGEEAYSLAILICEVLGDKLAQFNIKIFATDLDTASIAFARRGIYPTTALTGLSPALVERYFNPVKDGHEIKRVVRDLLVFAEHDLGQRAPFPHIDLVMCRNVLIYFNRELQRHALQLFAFALRDEGYLVLGRTETNSSLAEFFAPVTAEQRVYRRQGHRRLTQPLYVGTAKPNALPNPGGSSLAARRNFRPASLALAASSQNRAARDNLLLKLPIGVVVVNERFDIQEINSAARRLLSIHTVALGEDLVHLAQYVAPRELGAAITKAIQDKLVSNLEEVEVPQLTTGEANFLQLTCYPHPGSAETSNEAGNSPGYALILVTDTTQAHNSRQAIEQANATQAKAATELAENLAILQTTNARLHHSNEQLQQSNLSLAEAKAEVEAVATRHAQQMKLLIEANQGLLKANEGLTAQNLELRSNNEEYMLHSEEGQAAIEEADTLNEELQASNEELETLNEELQASIEELNSSNTELALQTTELDEQRQHSEQAKMQLTAVLDGMSDALVVVSTTGEVLLSNSAYQRIFQGSNKPVLLDEAGEEPLPIEATPEARSARAESFKMSFSFNLAEGEANQRWWEAVGQPIKLNDASNWGLLVMRDVTERSLRLSQEQFVALVTHELRTPLTIIKGHTELVQNWLERNPVTGSEKRLGSVRTALLQVERLEGLINDLADVNRLQNNKFKFNFSPMRLDTLLKETVEVGQQLTSTQKLELVGESGPVLVQGDAQRLQQVILNLINNALTHAPKSPRISLSLSQRAEHVELNVQDYGPGIKASHLPNLFSRFYQVSQGLAEGGQGLGLGLFICQQIVLAHGGTISVQSTEGKGTTFIVSLPLLAEVEVK